MITTMMMELIEFKSEFLVNRNVSRSVVSLTSNYSKFARTTKIGLETPAPKSFCGGQNTFINPIRETLYLCLHCRCL